MTRHDFEAWLDHHLDQPVLVEWRDLDDLGDFEAADFGGDGVVVELAKENAELYIAVS
jgi:hypothetical protein